MTEDQVDCAAEEFCRLMGSDPRSDWDVWQEARAIVRRHAAINEAIVFAMNQKNAEPGEAPRK